MLTAPMTEVYVTAATTVTVAIITALAGVAVALIPYLLQRRRIRRGDATLLVEVHEQVKNDHGTNLREDLDGLTERLDRISQDIGDVKSDVAGVRTQVRTLDRRLTKHIDGR